MALPEPLFACTRSIKARASAGPPPVRLRSVLRSLLQRLVAQSELTEEAPGKNRNAYARAKRLIINVFRGCQEASMMKNILLRLVNLEIRRKFKSV